MFPSFSLVNILETKKSFSFAALGASSVINSPPSIIPRDYSLPQNPPDPYLFVKPLVCPSTVDWNCFNTVVSTVVLFGFTVLTGTCVSIIAIIVFDYFL